MRAIDFDWAYRYSVTNDAPRFSVRSEHDCQRANWDGFAGSGTPIVLDSFFVSKGARDLGYIAFFWIM